jgi:hypothetical protein
MRRYLLTILYLSFSTFCLKAATDTIPASHKIEPMSDMVTLKLSHSSDVEKISVITPGIDIRLSPNTSSATRLGFSYRFISFGIRFAPRFLNGNVDDALKGKTRSGGLNVGFNFRHWLQELSYTRTKGYYLENTPELDPDWTADSPYIQFPGLSFTQYEGSTAYNFNPDFSVNAIVTQSERQLKSAGSFIPVFYYRYYINDHKTPPEPGGFNQKGTNLELLLGAGYHYNFVLKEKFYFALGLTPAAGYIFNKVTNRYATYSESARHKNFIFRIDGRAGLGYNSKRFFTGIYMRLMESAYREEKSSVIIENDKTVFHAVIGFRLNAPSWVKKPVDVVSRKIGIK